MTSLFTPGGEPPSTGLLRTLRALVTGTTHLVLLVEPDGTLVYASPSVTFLLGYSPDEFVGRNVLPLLHPDDLGMAQSMLATPSGDGRAGLSSDDADVSGEYRLCHADGRWVPFELLRNDFRADPAIGGILVVGREVTARRAFDEALATLAHDDEGREAVRKLARYLDVRIPGTHSAILIAGIDGTWITDQVPAELLVSGGPWNTLTPADEDTVIVDLQAVGGVTEPLRRQALALGFQSCWCVPLPVRRARVYSPLEIDAQDSPVLGCLVVWSATSKEPLVGHLGVLERVGGLADIILRRRMASRVLRDLVSRDQLTGALSRAGFEGLAEAGPVEPATILVIDLDDFKEVNDHFGHPVGDQALRVTAQRIQALLDPGDSLGRMGGDEFILRLPGVDVNRAISVADAILASLDEPLSVPDGSLVVGVSIGIAPFDPTSTPGELLERADVAMYAAKQDGKACWRVWNGAGSA